MSNTNRSISFAARSDLNEQGATNDAEVGAWLLFERGDTGRWDAAKQDRPQARERLGQRVGDDVLGHLIQVRRKGVVRLQWPVPAEVFVRAPPEEHRSDEAMPHPSAEP